MRTKKLLTREFLLGVILLLFLVFLSLTTRFFTVSGLFSLMLDVSPAIVGTIAMTLIIFTGNIDISAGTIMAFVAYTSADLARAGLPMIVFVPAGLLVGALLGGLNGYITVQFGVPSIVVTLAMNMVHLGFFATFLPRSGWIEGVPPSFTWFGNGRFFGLVPQVFLVAVVVAAFFIFIMKYTRFGKALYAVGGSRQAAGLAGINPDRTVFNVFLVEGLLLGVAALLKATATTNDVLPSTFVGRELDLIAASVVGGVGIFGGTGKILGAVFGAVLIYLLTVTMIYLGFQNYYQFALEGIIMLVAVYLTVVDVSKTRKRFRRLFGLDR